MNKVSKGLYIFGGILFIVIGIAGFMSSVYIYKNPFMVADKELIKTTAVKQCADVLRKQGFTANASTSKGSIEVIHQNLSEWQTGIAKMSYAFQSCQSLEMTDFCMGEICYNSKEFPITGIVAKLSYVKPVETIKK
jgi:hypothetical protein